MTLHDAIALVLRENNRAMTAREIADEINKRNLYQRGDGNPVPISQIHARVKNYPTLFEKAPARKIALKDIITKKKETDKNLALASEKKEPIKKPDQLNTLTIENFRTYKEKTSIELAPVTILTGRNNAGKSTIFKALLVLSDYLKSENQLVLEFDGPLAHKHKIDAMANALSWNSHSKYFKISYSTHSYIFEFTFGKYGNLGKLTKFTAKDKYSSYKLILENLSSSNYTIIVDTTFFENMFGFMTNEDNEFYFIQDFIVDLKIKLKNLQAELDNVKKEDKDQRVYLNLISEINRVKTQVKSYNDRLNKIKNIKKPNPGERVVSVDIDIEKELFHGNITLISLLKAKFSEIVKNEKIKQQYNKYSDDELQNDFVSTLNYMWSQMLVNYQHLGTNRTHQSRLYLNRNRESEINEIMHYYVHNKPPEGSKEDSFLKYWLRKFDIGDKITVKDVQSTASYIVITDEGKEQNLTDKGFGAGQVLTILMKIVNEIVRSDKLHFNPFESVNRPTIIIEEPETNLHPEFQSKLAEMFYDAYDKFGMKFILETHSEYLVRKTQTIIKHKQDLDAFKVYYIDKKKGISEMRYREDGKFIDEFGSGFFDESTNLSLELF